MEDRYEWEPVRTDYHRSDRHGTALGLRLSAGLCALLWFCLPASAAVTIVDDGDAGYSESVIFGVLEGGYGSDNRQSNSGGATAAYSFTGTPNTYYEVLNNVAWVSTTDYPSTPYQIVGAVRVFGNMGNRPAAPPSPATSLTEVSVSRAWGCTRPTARGIW